MLRETGKPLLQHTYEAAQSARTPQDITVAVESPELRQVVEQFGGSWVMTDPDLPSGTDRVVEVARQKPEIDIFVNVQGDEPEIEGAAIDQVVELLVASPAASVATLAAPITSREQLEDPACVKVVRNHAGRALYFSRSPIPHVRNWEEGFTPARTASVLAAHWAVRLSQRVSASAA